MDILEVEMAILFSGKVFEGSISGTTAVYTGSELYRTIAQGEKFYVEVRAAQTTTGATVTVALEQSNEASAFVAAWEVKATLISAAATSPTVVNYVRGYDLGTTKVGAGNMRLAISLGGATPTAYVEAWLTVRSND